jgi:acetoin utilization protein AcuB
MPAFGALRKRCAPSAARTAASHQFHGTILRGSSGIAAAQMEDMKSIPTIQRYMSTSPHTIGAEQTLAKADEVMRKHKIRHLPVMQGAQLVGIVSERDLQIVLGIKGADANSLNVEDVMTQDVITVEPDTGLDEASALMVERRAGSVVVMQNRHVVGIFTTVDGMQALSELLQTRLKAR